MIRPNTYSVINTGKRITIAASALALAIALGGLPRFAAAQDQSSAPPPQQQAGPQDQAAPPPGEQAPPPPGPGPYGQGPYGQPPYGQGPYGQRPYGYPQGGYPQGGQQQEPPPAPLPATLTIPAGTEIRVRVNDFLSSDQSKVGQMFTAALDQPLLANGWVVARRGQEVTGQVSVAQKAEKGKNDSQLGIVLTELTLADGQQVPVTTELMQTAAGGSPYDTNRKVGTVAGTTVLGTAIGAIAGGGAGAAIGAGIGATTGGAIVLSTRGRPTVIPREALVTFRLQQPVSVTTNGNQNAFREAGPQDFGGDQDAYGRYPGGPGYGPAYGQYPPQYGGYPPPPPPQTYYYGAYPYAWGYPYYPFYAYPGPFAGFGFGFYGPRYGGFYRGFRR